MTTPRAAARLLLAVAAVALAAAVLPAAPARAQRIAVPPRPSALVSDNAGLLAPGERAALERKLVALDDSTGIQIAVVILPSLNDEDPAYYAAEIISQWGIGKRGVDNGAVVLMGVEDRQVFIGTGLGMEAALPDALAGRIVADVLVPRFRAGQFYAGLDEGTDAIAAAARGEFTPQPRAPSGGGGGGGGDFLFLLLLILVFVVLPALNRRRRGPPGRGRRGPGVVVVPWGFGGGGWSGGGGFGGGFGGGGGGGFGGFGGGGGGGGGAGGSW